MERLENILQKEMTRKEFLATLGLGLISVLGMGAVVRLLFGKARGASHTATSYGASAYGGPKS